MGAKNARTYEKGIHGLSKVSLGPAMPDHSMPCRQPPLKRPYGRFRSGSLQDRQPAAVFLPPLDTLSHMPLLKAQFRFMMMDLV
jgi:hypothetical protein